MTTLQQPHIFLPFFQGEAAGLMSDSRFRSHPTTQTKEISTPRFSSACRVLATRSAQAGPEAQRLPACRDVILFVVGRNVSGLSHGLPCSKKHRCRSSFFLFFLHGLLRAEEAPVYSMGTGTKGARRIRGCVKRGERREK